MASLSRAHWQSILARDVWTRTIPATLALGEPQRSTFWNDTLHEQGLPASLPGALEANIDAGQVHLGSFLARGRWRRCAGRPGFARILYAFR